MATMLVGVFDQTKTFRSFNVPCPLSPMEMPYNTRSTVTQLYNGENSVSASSFRRREMSFSWLGTQAQLQPLINLFSGFYGDGPFYALNPFAVGGNVLPPQWSVPWRAAQRRGGGAVMRLSTPFAFGGGTNLPNPYAYSGLSLTGATGLPVLSMRGYFPIDATTVPDPLFVKSASVYPIPYLAIPIPAGQAGRIAAWGSLESGTVPLRYIFSNTAPTSNTTGVTTLTPTLSGASATFASDAVNDRLLWIWMTTPATSAATLNLAAMGLWLGSTAPSVPAAFDTGQGWTSFKLKGDLNVTGYSTPSTGARKQIGVSFDATEAYIPW